LLQAPQFDGLVEVSIHEYPHQVVPAGHVVHALPLQCWPAGQTTPQAPQLLLSVASVTSQYVGSESQSACPGVHCGLQTLPEHDGVPKNT
jgi:hypothetical protein